VQVLAAKFLEESDQTLTARERKAAIREIDVNNDGQMACVEYLLYKYIAAVGSAEAVVAAKQGHAQEVAACQAVIDRVTAMLPDVEAKLAGQQAAKGQVVAALAAVKRAQVEAKTALGEQERTEAQLVAAARTAELAKAELAKAVAELAAQEAAVAAEVERLGALVADSTVGQVKRGVAANTLAALKNEDPLPLRRAKLTAEAALRKVQRKEAAARTAAADAANATAQCKAKCDELADRETALETRKTELEEAVRALERSYTELSSRMGEAQTALAELKQGTTGLGAVWWMERSLYLADESLPRAKQQFDHTKPFQFDVTSAVKQQQHTQCVVATAPKRSGITTINAVQLISG
jgi:DNA repair exonuclease SbcCD ATPase subunit